jgi:tripartite-type tricarboxylate transporter receptor subunit TctC
MKIFTIILAVLSVALSFGIPVKAQENFFAGKTIRIVVGSSSGGGYDYWARLRARHMSKYIRAVVITVPRSQARGVTLERDDYRYIIGPLL